MAEQRTISVRELKAHASELLRLVQAGEEMVVTVRGRPVARIQALDASAARATDGAGGTRGILAGIPGMPEFEWEDFQEAKRMWEPRDLDDDS